MTTYGQLATGRMTPAEREFMLAVDGDMPQYIIGVDLGAREDRTVEVLERWFRDGRGERKIGDGPWEPIENPYWHAQPPFVLMEIPPDVHTNCSSDFCNSLVVEWCIDILIVICGHCHEARRLGDDLCCDWAKGMYQKYFSEVR